MDLSEIAKSVSDMSDEELKNRILELRQSYRTPKVSAQASIKREKAAKKKVDDISVEDAKALLALLQSQIKG